MKIDYVSDIHINHHVLFKKDQIKWENRTKEWTKELLKSGTHEVLVIAGDFSEWNCQAIWFLEEASKYYEKVFFVTGNHDYYLLSKSQKKKYIDSKGRQQEFLELASQIPNVEPLYRDVVNYKGKVIAGDSLWYLPETDEDWEFFFNVSNDFCYISVLEGYSSWTNSKKDQVRFLYKEAMDWYQTLEQVEIDLMISHIPPLHPPISPYERNACYDCKVPFLAAPHWICGHQHIQNDFKKADTHFWMNALGYPSEKGDLSIKTLEI